MGNKGRDGMASLMVGWGGGGGINLWRGLSIVGGGGGLMLNDRLWGLWGMWWNSVSSSATLSFVYDRRMSFD